MFVVPQSSLVLGVADFPGRDPLAGDAEVHAGVVLQELAHGHVAGVHAVALAGLAEAGVGDGDEIVADPGLPYQLSCFVLLQGARALIALRCAGKAKGWDENPALHQTAGGAGHGDAGDVRRVSGGEIDR